ncbi:WW domain-containing oxidoreductase-like isoform X2 [Montipora capricornis]|uniref:WW domain-containing oxidoreductase-like isoform X2 n=1 Tax=Montipora capricornis TaxID=246305 RepID=UPI0035F1CAFE
MGGACSYPTTTLPSSRTVIVTGANTGIGYETAKAVAQMGARVIVACRSEQRAKEAIKKMQEEHAKESKNTALQENDRDQSSSDQLLVEYMHLDLSSLKSTMDFVEAFKQTGHPLHVLVCNAGIAFANQTLTDDGYESHFQVNYLSHLLLVLNLLPLMKMSGPDVRVVFVSSLMETWQRKLNIENIQGQQSYSSVTCYSSSKLFMVSTEIARRLNQDYTLFKFGLRVSEALGLAKSPKEGAVTTINCAVNPELAGVSGVYYINCKAAQPSKLARNEEEQEKLWNYSIECLKGFVAESVLLDLGLSGSSEVKATE